MSLDAFQHGSESSSEVFNDPQFDASLEEVLHLVNANNPNNPDNLCDFSV